MRRVSGRTHERLVPKLGNLTGLSPPRLGVSPPGLPASRSAPTSCARPARLPPVPWPGSQAPVRAATREQGRDGRHDREGGGGRGAEREAGARTAGPRARRPRRVLSRLRRPRCGRSAPTRCSPAPAPPQPNQIGSLRHPVPSPGKSHWTSRKWRFVGNPGGRSLQLAEGLGGARTRREFPRPAAARDPALGA